MCYHLRVLSPQDVKSSLYDRKRTRAASSATATLSRLRTAVIRMIDGRPHWQRFMGLTILFIAVSALWGYQFIRAHLPLSFQDEYVYIDAVDKATRGIITRNNSLIDEYSINVVSCRGVEMYGYQGSGCGAPVDPSKLPYEGYTTASIHSPVYFFITAWLSKLILLIRPGGDLLQTARITGALWLGLGLAVTWVLVRRLGGNRTIAMSISLLLLASPMLRWSNFYVTPDSFSLLSGSLIFLCGLMIAREEWPSWTLIVISMVAGAIKFQMLFATVAMALFITLRQMNRRGSGGRWWRPALGAIAAVISGLVVQFSYQYLRIRFSLPYHGTFGSVDPAGPFSKSFAVEQLDNFIYYLYAGPAATNRSVVYYYGLPHAFVIISAALLVSALVAAALFSEEVSADGRSLARSVLFSLIALGPLFYMYISISTGSIFELSPRYAEALFPAYAIGLPLVVKDRRTKTLILLFAFVAIFFAMYNNDIR